MSLIPTDAQGNTPKWVIYGGLGAAALGLFAFMRSKQSSVGGSTVAAGTSINAALGSIQEEQLNTQGDIGKLSQQMQLNDLALGSSIQQSSQALGSQIQQNDIAIGQAVDINRMVLSQMPGGQYAYTTVAASAPAQQAFTTEGTLYGGGSPAVNSVPGAFTSTGEANVPIITPKAAGDGSGFVSTGDSSTSAVVITPKPFPSLNDQTGDHLTVASAGTF